MQENHNHDLSDHYIHSREILIVEDDVALCQMMTSFLAKHGWIVHVVHTGQQALETFRRSCLAMILLDIGLPDYSGFDLMREMHRFVDTPVIVISAHGEETDRIVGLELGADDYLAKPFSLRELLARMEAVARRSVSRSRLEFRLPPIVIDTFLIYTETREVFYGTTKLALSATEFQLLRFLLQRPYEVCSRELLVRTVLLRAYEPLDRSLDMHILRLRRKLKGLSKFRGGIRTVRSGGYMLALHPEKSIDI
ncbi:two-component system, OmpR family, response regulator CpxR [Granulicella pectinivorans]|uniref:Two-component system, OmpR family, response regulator CpxR n=1 Tax=Granulicella pectinivorans TaxID=474950 RepID=A0A1I6M8Y3_9BACT|nr:response regulator transcription factor [Granulicella pectinivorans]SFS12073.1 two-component system, OmpR family, response regulator CpxR [Granulicella pectinivorans]